MPSSNDTSAGALEFDVGRKEFSNRLIPAALQHFHEAERLGYDADRCAAYRWDCYMLLGQFEAAWRESDKIAGRGTPDPHQYWDGLPFTGKRVIIRCLHGYGDAIQFIRYAPQIRNDAARVIVQSHPELVSLLRGMASVDAVISWGEDGLPGATPGHRQTEWDQQVEIMELPRIFRTTEQTIPCPSPYLSARTQACARSREALGCPGKPRIGILWQASNWNPARSIPIAELAPVLDLAGFAFYSFQRGAPEGELAALESRYRIHDTSRHSPEIADTAADLMNIDLLITVDSMAAHLAGALGRPVWVLLPFEADWRWMLDRDDSPWYPTMKLFRQPAPGAWRPVVQRIVQELSRPMFIGGGP